MSKSVENGTRPWVRVLILSVAMFVLGIVVMRTTGQIIPNDPSEAVLVQNSILLLVLGSLILEKHFTAPGDALVNAFTALITIIPLFPSVSRGSWIAVATYLVLVMVAGIVCLSLQSAGHGGGAGKAMAVAYLIASKLGKAQVVFSVVFLAAIFFFANERSALALPLLVFWGLYLAIWPLGIPQFISRLKKPSVWRGILVGNLDRIDSPNIARVALATSESWPGGDASVAIHLHDGSARWGIPLFRENRSDGSWGTFLISPRIVPGSGRAGTVVLPPSAEAGPTCSELVAELAGVEGASLVGIVREGSNLSRLRVEILPESQVSSGQVFVVPSSEGPVHYQVAEAETAEESFGGLNYGAHIASATQIGMLKNGRFERFNYLPMMNELVFEWPTPVVELGTDDRRFTLGVVPGTGVSLRGDFVQNLESHTAILGTTGSGKTEFAFDLIRHALQNGVNVICIDLTSQYAPRLSDLDPVQLSIPVAQAADLGKRLFEADTGAYGGGAEKKVLDQFAKVIRADIRKALEEFYAGSAGSLGLIELNEISNTKATLWITEMYLSTLLELAREGKTGNNKTVVVVEEAHTVMPEASFSGLGDFDSKGTIAKITQIALQGRKYGVGLLVLAQRTATVSKSVLTQCNTIVSFSCVDDTSINFLRNVYGSTVAEGLPQLPRLRAIAHGLWIDAEQPIAFDVPYDKNKAERKGWSFQTQPQSGTASTTAAPNALPVSAAMEDAPF